MDALTEALIASTIDRYNEIRDKAYKAIKADHSLMGTDEWLVHALIEGDMNIHSSPTGLRIWGSTFTSQTMENEWFDFQIPYSALD